MQVRIEPHCSGATGKRNLPSRVGAALSKVERGAALDDAVASSVGTSLTELHPRHRSGAKSAASIHRTHPARIGIGSATLNEGKRSNQLVPCVGIRRAGHGRGRSLPDVDAVLRRCRLILDQDARGSSREVGGRIDAVNGYRAGAGQRDVSSGSHQAARLDVQTLSYRVHIALSRNRRVRITRSNGARVGDLKSTDVDVRSRIAETTQRNRGLGRCRRVVRPITDIELTAGQ